MTDPHDVYPRPLYPGDQQQASPGLSSKMAPKSDHGEESYVGKGLLEGKVALITGGDQDLFELKSVEIVLPWMMPCFWKARGLQRGGLRSIHTPSRPSRPLPSGVGGDGQERRFYRQEHSGCRNVVLGNPRQFVGLYVGHRYAIRL